MSFLFIFSLFNFFLLYISFLYQFFWNVLIATGVGSSFLILKGAAGVVKKLRSAGSLRGAISNNQFWPGGFNEKMDKTEAALILGCRKNMAREAILAKYKKVMILNHPDRGGSPFIASKINEAKDLLTKGQNPSNI